jgi:hypothetical protein
MWPQRQARPHRPLHQSARSDAWENEVTGFGTRRDKSAYGTCFANRVLSAEELSDLYVQERLEALGARPALLAC